MEFGILSGVNANNYEYGQDRREGHFSSVNGLALPNYLEANPYQQRLATDNNFGTVNSCADSYPLYSPDYVKHQQKILSGLGGGHSSKNIDDKRKIEKQVKKHMNRGSDTWGNTEHFANFIPADDPVSEMMLDLEDRPITDFYHNNMVPFYKGNSTKQSMAGTGVASGSYVDGSNVPGNITGINSGFDYSTPWQTQLANYTGLDDTYMHKREAGPMFSPAEQQTGWVYGTPLFRPDMDRYTQGLSQIRNDLTPVEPEMVGPGLNIDPEIPASGGFHEFTRILPNNVNDYKANQLPGQVISGKYFSAGLPTAYPGIGVSGEGAGSGPGVDGIGGGGPGVVKNRPNTFWDQSRLPTMTTKVGFQGNLDYIIPQYEVDFKPNNATRDQTSYGLGNLEYRRMSQ